MGHAILVEAESGPPADGHTDLSAVLKDLCEQGAWPLERVKCSRLDSAIARGLESRLWRALMNVIDSGVRYGREVEITPFATPDAVLC